MQLHDEQAPAMCAKRAGCFPLRKENIIMSHVFQEQHLTLLYQAYHMHMLTGPPAGKNQRLAFKKRSRSRRLSAACVHLFLCLYLTFGRHNSVGWGRRDWPEESNGAGGFGLQPTLSVLQLIDPWGRRFWTGCVSNSSAPTFRSFATTA